MADSVNEFSAAKSATGLGERLWSAPRPPVEEIRFDVFFRNSVSLDVYCRNSVRQMKKNKKKYCGLATHVPGHHHRLLLQVGRGE
jgi:hypothetical protein